MQTNNEAEGLINRAETVFERKVPKKGRYLVIISPSGEGRVMLAHYNNGVVESFTFADKSSWFEGWWELK